MAVAHAMPAALRVGGEFAIEKFRSLANTRLAGSAHELITSNVSVCRGWKEHLTSSARSASSQAAPTVGAADGNSCSPVN
jgi:hypothetical protein